MFGIGFPELLLILALALIVVGPDKLPDLARSLAKTLVDLRRTAEGLKRSIEAEANPLADIKPQLEDAAKNFKETVLDAQKSTTDTPADLSRLEPSTDDNQPASAAPADEGTSERHGEEQAKQGESKGAIDKQREGDR